MFLILGQPGGLSEAISMKVKWDYAVFSKLAGGSEHARTRC